MKTKIEVLGYEIEIEEVDGVVTVKAEFDGDIVEEFTLEAQEEEGQGSQEGEEGQDDDDIKGFEDFGGQEEEDFDGDFDGGQDDEELGQVQTQTQSQDDDEVKLESFDSFFKRK